MGFEPPTNRPYVVAELGFNHNGRLETAKRLIRSVAEAGADCAKLQLFRTDYLIAGEYLPEVVDVFRNHEISREDYLDLKQTAREENIDLAASVFDRELLSWYVEETDPPFIKIASGDVTFKRLLVEAGRTSVPLVLSLGAATRPEIKRALEWIDPGQDALYLLHCVPRYPTPEEGLNLWRIPWLRDRFEIPVGFSDHSQSSLAPLAASALGAVIWERHVTLDRSQDGPEHAFSMDVEAFAGVIQRLPGARGEDPEELAADAPAMLGEEEPDLTEEEKEFRQNARRSLMADRPLSAGSILRRDMIRELRPGTGLPADKIDQCLGLRIPRPTDPKGMISY